MSMGCVCVSAYEFVVVLAVNMGFVCVSAHGLVVYNVCIGCMCGSAHGLMVVYIHIKRNRRYQIYANEYMCQFAENMCILL